ncbi:MAG: helix-turn-helix transcriptional regulator [Firmicutes bacterium]|nr:helix-turn-helix transcriptional regulator [Bacillota bacterium]
MNLIDLGLRIQAAREEKRMSQEQLASAIGCSQSALSNYEKGKRRVYLSQLERLSEVLDKPLNYFVENFETDREQPPLNSKENRILGIINSVYRLTEEEVDEVDGFIQYLMWKRIKGGNANGPLAE